MLDDAEMMVIKIKMKTILIWLYEFCYLVKKGRSRYIIREQNVFLVKYGP